MSNITLVILFLPCIVWSDVSAQCRDPLIYKLDDIYHLIANLTANITHCTAEIDNMKETVEDLRTTVARQDAENNALNTTLSLIQNGKHFKGVLYSMMGPDLLGLTAAV